VASTGAAPAYEISQILALGAAAIRVYGFCSNKVARERGGVSTTARVSAWFSQKYFEITPADTLLAAEVLAWLATLSSRRSLNNYMHTFSVLRERMQHVREPDFGIFCAAVITYINEQKSEGDRRTKSAADASSEYIGEVGKRTLLENLTLIYTKRWGMDSPLTFYKFRDGRGNVIIWIASRELQKGGRPLQNGDVVALRARVIKHEEYRGVKQTHIRRAAIAG
jgi:hypothetical protein